MDPISQACFGASLSQSVTHNKAKHFSILAMGALSAMAPDLDVLIRSSDDPLLFLEYHRQFSHSLFFIPFGALLCAVVFYPFFKKNFSLAKIYLYSFLGVATHGLLDACTSYGTQLYWPFSNERIAWNIVSIVDPLFTLPVVIFILFAAFKKKVRYARIGFIYAIVFLGLGFFQKYRAEDATNQLALQRGHTIERLLVKPSFANRHLWKMIYEYNGQYYVDAVKLLFNTKIIPGTSIAKLNINRDLAWLNIQELQRKDIERFRWFSDDFLAINPQQKNIIIDMRYSFVPNRIKMMWGIELTDNNRHVAFKIKSSPDKQSRKDFLDMLF